MSGHGRLAPPIWPQPSPHPSGVTISLSGLPAALGWVTEALALFLAEAGGTIRPAGGGGRGVA